MPIDIEFLRTLSEKEQNNLKNKLETALEATYKDLSVVEGKLKMAMSDPNSNLSDLQPLLSYRNELKQVYDQFKFDLEQVNRFVSQGNYAGASSNPGSLKIATGTVSIRGDDSKSVRVPGAKTFQEILDERKKQEDAKELAILDERLKKVEEYRKLEQSKKQTQKQTSSQTSQTA